MENENRLTLGPFFTTARFTLPKSDLIVPLNLEMEWSTAKKATRIPLFRHLPPHAPESIRLEHIVFRRVDLPCDLECRENQTVTTPEVIYLPLDPLLGALYRRREISRPVFQLLNDLVAVVPLRSRVSNPITTRGLLAAEAEAKGFRLNAVFREDAAICAQIGWESGCRSLRFHACLASFKRSPNRALHPGIWRIAGEIGVAQILADQLHQLKPGNPLDLLSETGIQLLERSFRAWAEATDQRS